MYSNLAFRTDDRDERDNDRRPIIVEIPPERDRITAQLRRAFEDVRREPLPRDMEDLLENLN